jgi:hypothetical protein
MPRLILLGGGMSGGGGGGGSCCCEDSTIDRNSAIFFNTLANKLLEMSQAVETKIEEIKKNCHQAPSGGRGFLFASIDAPSMVLAVPREYTEYIKRYGPPPKGKFEPIKLEIIRTQLGIETGRI